MDEDDIVFLKEVKSNCQDQRAPVVRIKIEPGTESASPSDNLSPGLQLDKGPSDTYSNSTEIKNESIEEGRQNFAGEVSGTSFTNPSENNENNSLPGLQSEENILTFDQQTVTSADPSKSTEEIEFEILKGSKELIAVPSDEEILNFSGSENFLYNDNLSETNDLPIFSTDDEGFDFHDFEDIMDSDSPTIDQPSQNTLVTNDSQEMSPLEIPGPILACIKEEPAEKAESTNANFFSNCDIPNDIVDLTSIPISNGGNESTPFLENAITSAREDASTEKPRMEPISGSANEISHLGLLETPPTTQSSSAVEISSARQPIPTLGREYASETFPFLRRMVYDSQSNDQITMYSLSFVPPLDKIITMNRARFPSLSNDDASRNPPIAIQPPKSSSNDNDKDGKCVPKYRKAIAVHEKNKMLERNRHGNTENEISTTTGASEETLAYNRVITDNWPTTNTSQNKRKISIESNSLRGQQVSIKSSTGRDAGSACASDQLFLGGSQHYSGGFIMTEPSMWLNRSNPKTKHAYRKMKIIFPSLQHTRYAYPSYQFYESSNHYSGGSIIAEPSTTFEERGIPIVYKWLFCRVGYEENFGKKVKKARNLKPSGVSSNKREKLSKRGQYRPRRTVTKMSDAQADIHENTTELSSNHEETISQLKTAIHRRKSNSSDMHTECPKRQRTKSASTTRKRNDSCSGRNKKAPVTAQSPVATITAPQDPDLIFPSYEGNLICGNNESEYFFISNDNVRFLFHIYHDVRWYCSRNTSVGVSSSTTQNYFDSGSPQAEKERFPTTTDSVLQSDSSHKLFILEISHKEEVLSCGKLLPSCMVISHYLIELKDLEAFKTLVEKMKMHPALSGVGLDSDLNLIGFKKIFLFTATICSDSLSVLLNAFSSATNLKPGTSPNATTQVKSTSTKEPAHKVCRNIYVGFSDFPTSELVSVIEGHYTDFKHSPTFF